MKRCRRYHPFFLLVLFSLGCGQKKPTVVPDSDTGSDVSTEVNTEYDTNTETDSDTLEEDVFEVQAEISEMIPTVGVVTWSIEAGPLTEAYIEFGRGGFWEYTADVDLNAPQYRTLLLGMKPDTRYTFRIIAKDADKTYTSNSRTITTGARPVSLPPITLSPEKCLPRGFIVSTLYTKPGDAFIIDKDGDYVWWYDSPNMGDDGVRARMTWDGKSMVIANGNVDNRPDSGTLVKVDMDGTNEQVYDVPRRHHDVAVLPDGTIAYFEYNDDESCEIVKEIDPDGNMKEIVDLGIYFDGLSPEPDAGPLGGGECHTNAINYVQKDDAYTLSILNFNAFIKIDRDGNKKWIFGGESNEFEGAGSWQYQHQHQLLDGKFIFFNNETGFRPSRVKQYDFDEDAMTATEEWSFSNGGQSIAMGDAKRLPDGTTLATYSASGQMILIGPGPNPEELCRILWTRQQSSIGFSSWRDSLYGPPQE